MKKSGTYIVGLLFFAAFSETALAVEDSISPATIPPSSRQGGLIRTPNPVNQSGNLLITGNVRGGKYFRGVVPYRASTDFRGTLPSSSLDSFLRDSAGSEDIGGYTSVYKPFYSLTQTVTTKVPGHSGVSGTSTADIGGYTAQLPAIGTSPPRSASMLNTVAGVSLKRWRPMSMTQQELEKLISSDITAYSQSLAAARQVPGLTDLQYQARIEQFKRDPNQVSEKIAGLKERLTSQVSSVTEKPTGEVPWWLETPTQKEQAYKESYEESAETPFIAPPVLNKLLDIDVYEQMKQQLDKLQKDLERLAVQQPQKTAGPATVEGGRKAAEEQAQESSQAGRLAEVSLAAARAKGILGPYETFASFSEDKFNQHMRAAEQYLKQGKYYRAADAYTLASIYKSDDPLAYAGKSHALFASGEYMSSALYLSRALQIFPEYVRFKIDIVAMVGDKDTLDTRVADVEEWLKKTDAPELYFLLAYVYYQMDKPQSAKEAIDAASEMMPDAQPVLVLKKAIEAQLPPAGDNIQRTADDAEPVPSTSTEKK
jgi:tetratricopeptide (TPR) repeat protein